MNTRFGVPIFATATALALLTSACGSSSSPTSSAATSNAATSNAGTSSATTSGASSAGPATTAAAASAGGAGSTSAAVNTTDTKATINYFTFSAAPDHIKDLNTIVAAFEKQHPNITVKVQTAAYADYFTKLSTELAGGTAPDTFELDYQDFVNYASSGSLLSLAGANASSYSPASYTASSLKAFAYNGEQMALPESFSDVVLFYNKTLFDKAGVAYPTSTWTWADEMSAAKKLTDKATGVYGLFQPVTYNEFYKALNQAGGQFLSADNKSATFNSAAGLTAANWLISKLGTVMPTLTQIGSTPNFDTNLFMTNKLAMWINGNWQFAGLAKQAGWDVAVEPGDTQKASAVFFNGVAASKTSKHAAAALEWINFLSSSKTSVTTRVSSNWELPPVADSTLISGYLTATPPANRKAVIDSLDAPSLAPVIAKQTQMQDIVNTALQNAAAGRGTVQSNLDKAASQVTALLK
jgi:multiple sugar transport system substrate-binding protein